MPNENNKILKYNPGEKSMKALFIIYAELESLLEKTSTCHNNPKKSSTTKVNKHTASGYSLFTHCSFDNTKNEFHYDRGSNSMKTFCFELKEHATKIINFEEKKEIIPLTNEKNDSYLKQEVFHICKKEFIFDIESCSENMYIKCCRVKDNCHYTGKYRGAAHNICIQDTKHQKKLLLFFIMVPHMPIILLLNN